jgi:hypothetical protein
MESKFIKGGPVCKRCKGKGRVYARYCGTYWCSDCRETGFKPLSRWTADECAEYLWANRYIWVPKRLTAEVVVIDLYEGDYVIGDKWRFSSEGKTFTEALRAAVLAVAEETGQVLNAK